MPAPGTAIPAAAPPSQAASQAPSPARPSPFLSTPKKAGQSAPSPVASKVGPLGRPATSADLTPVRTADVEIVSQPAGAEIVVNGQPRGETPARVTLEYGQHRVALRKSGYRSMEREVAVSDRTPPRVMVELQAERPVEQPAPAGTVGRVVVRTVPPGARVVVDGQKTNYRSPVNFALPVGKHKITVERDGFAPQTNEVNVRRDQTVQLDIGLRGEGAARKRRFFFR